VRGKRKKKEQWQEWSVGRSVGRSVVWVVGHGRRRTRNRKRVACRGSERERGGEGGSERSSKGTGVGKRGGAEGEREIASRLLVDYVSRRRRAACPSFRKRSRVRPEKKSRCCVYNRGGLEFRDDDDDDDDDDDEEGGSIFGSSRAE